MSPKRIAPPRILPGGSGTSRRIEVAVTLLPQPDSPTSPSVLPCSIVNDTPSTATQQSRLGVEPDLQFVDLQQRQVCARAEHVLYRETRYWNL